MGPSLQLDNTSGKLNSPNTGLAVAPHPSEGSGGTSAGLALPSPPRLPHPLLARPFPPGFRATHTVFVSAPTTVTRIVVHVGQGLRVPPPTQAVLEVRGQKRSRWAWQPAALRLPLLRGPGSAAAAAAQALPPAHVLASTLSRRPQIFPESLFGGAINTRSIANNMRSGNCQQTFVVPTTGSAYVTIKLPGSGCPLAGAGNYVIALRTASGNPAFTYWAVGGGIAPDPAGVWSHVSFRTWTNGVLSTPLTPPGIGSLQIIATN